MSDMPKHPRLIKRGTVFYHRAAVPEDIRATYGKREEVKSLGTRDPREALRLVRIEAGRVDVLFEAHREELRRRNAPKLKSLTAEQILVITNAQRARMLAIDEEDRLRGFKDDDEFNQFVQDTEDVEIIAKELYAKGIVPGFVKNWFAEITEELKLPWILEEDSESWRVLSREMVKTSVLAFADLKKRNAGEIIDTPVITIEDAQQSHAAAVTLSDLFKRWERDHLKEGKSRKTVRDFEQKLAAFIEYLGHEDALKVTRRNVVEFCDMLRHDKGLSANTVSTKYFAVIRLLYRTGLGKAVIDYNPTTHISIAVPKRIRVRPKGFTHDEAITILSATLRDPETLGRMSELNKLAIRWAPWICAYTGARITEVTQLRKQDFEIEKGVHYIRITPEAGAVKTGDYRFAPLHPHLLEMGILDFVSSRPDGPLFYKPTKEVLESGHSRAASVSGKISKWVRQVAGVTDRLVQPNHGWRHRFKTEARNADISRDNIDAIQGHNDGTASVDYGDYPIPALFREIQKLPKYDVSSQQTALN